MADWELGVPPDDYEGNPFPHGIWEVSVSDMMPDGYKNLFDQVEPLDLSNSGKPRQPYIIGLDREKDTEYT